MNRGKRINISWDEKIEYLANTVLGLEDILYALIDKLPEAEQELDRLYNEAIEYNKHELD